MDEFPKLKKSAANRIATSSHSTPRVGFRGPTIIWAECYRETPISA
jgi:hypothetical protein